jgi:hypothetical protein
MDMDGPHDVSIPWRTQESINAEEEYYERERNTFTSKSLSRICKQKFLDTPIKIEGQPCFMEISGICSVNIDCSHNILQVYDSTNSIYEIPIAKNLFIERKECNRIIEENTIILKKTENEAYHLSNIRTLLNPLIEETYQNHVKQMQTLKEIIQTNKERVTQIEKELTVAFACFISKIK